MKDYNMLLQSRIDKSFNTILKVTSVIAFFAGLVLLFADLNKVYALLNFISASIMMVLSIYANKIKTATKIISLIFVTSVIAIASFIGGGFSSAFLILLILTNVIAALFLQRKQSIIISFLSVLLLIGLCGYSLSTARPGLIKELYFNWSLLITAYILLVVVLHISVQVVKTYLVENINALEESKTHSDQLAYYDTLTKLPNIHKFKAVVYEQFNNQVNTGYVVYMSLKNLGSINSVLGHEYGDQTLLAITKLLNNYKIEKCVIARTGGNEFAIWFSEMEEAELIAYMKNLNNELDKQSLQMKKKLDFYAVYALCDKRVESLETTLRKASLTLTYVKSNNILCLTSYNNSLEDSVRRSELLKDLISEAMAKKEFKLYYQAKYDSRNNQVIGYEGLARWESKELGLVMPGEFIPVIESLNMAVEFGTYVLDLGCQEFSKLQSKTNEEISISINVSPNHIVDVSIVETVRNILEKYKLPAHCLILEITEDIIIVGLEKVKPILKALKALNVKISLDDFGTGYSSLNYLSQLDLDELKIDKSLVDQLDVEKSSYIILENIMYLAKQFNLEIIAEGVEEKNQLNILNDLKCYRIQGYYFAKPMPLNEIMNL